VRAWQVHNSAGPQRSAIGNSCGQIAATLTIITGRRIDMGAAGSEAMSECGGPMTRMPRAWIIIAVVVPVTACCCVGLVLVNCLRFEMDCCRTVEGLPHKGRA
jgi:hypothetical protein